MKSSQNKSQSYSPEFRESAVKLARQSEYSVAATARELGVNVNTLHTWIKKYHHPEQETSKRAGDLPVHDQLKVMKKQVKRLTEERDILKKAAAYFASQSS
jgi:transposase